MVLWCRIGGRRLELRLGIGRGVIGPFFGALCCSEWHFSLLASPLAHFLMSSGYM